MRLAFGKQGKDHRNVLKRLKGKNFKVDKCSAKDRDTVIDGIVDKLGLSDDIFRGAEIISMVGKRNLVLENYVKVVLYEEDKIVVKTKKNYVTVEGVNLKIEYMMDIELRISGRIDKVCFSMNI